MDTFSIIKKISQIPQEEWNQLLTQDNPFLDHRYLAALEETACVSEATGWLPRHIILRRDGQLLAALPCYQKLHSYGEYVFDWTWAEAYQRYGMNYYPKLLNAIPFTPVNGPRILGASEYHPRLLEYLIGLGSEQAASGWHINYPHADHPSELYGEHHFQARYQCQFQWFNRNYTEFDDFLSHFTSRKRKSVKKERKQLAQQNIQVRRYTGAEISDSLLDFFYRCYQTTHMKKGSAPYLTPAFFQRILSTMREHLLLVVAEKDEQAIATALYFYDQHSLYGRYWGCIDEVSGLHFELCYYQGIEFCIEQELQHFDPGTQGEHKISRGFEPVISRSFHRLQDQQFHQAVMRFCQEEKQYIDEYFEAAEQQLPFNQNWLDTFKSR